MVLEKTNVHKRNVIELLHEKKKLIHSSMRIYCEVDIHDDNQAKIIEL